MARFGEIESCVQDRLTDLAALRNEEERIQSLMGVCHDSFALGQMALDRDRIETKQDMVIQGLQRDLQQYLRAKWGAVAAFVASEATVEEMNRQAAQKRKPAMLQTSPANARA